ncbi:MAG TPA: hypothetical protein VH353_00360 [Caulobacteraceae bacterium]|nr:hypothetical protein [Caulobacteraceae bacterium]
MIMRVAMVVMVMPMTVRGIMIMTFVTRVIVGVAIMAVVVVLLVLGVGRHLRSGWSRSRR